MPRRSLALPGCLALLLAAAAPALACGERGGPCAPAASPPAAIVIPPIVGQQIEIGSAPITLPDGPPPASDESSSAVPVVPFAGDGGIASVTDLDHGVAAWGVIVPGEDFVKLPPHGITFIGLTEPAPHARPLPPKTEQSIGLNLVMEVSVPITQKGVPGISQPSLGSGNRALWFAPPAGE